MNVLSLADNKYLLVIDKGMSPDLFVLNAKVKEGTYAFNLVNRISEMLFLETVDLKKEYENYYSKEFESFKDFLIDYFHVEEEIADSIVERMDCLILLGDTYSYGDYGLSFLFPDQEREVDLELNDIIDSLLEVDDDED